MKLIFNAIMIGLILASGTTYAAVNSLETNMCIKNSRSTPVTLQISGINNKDWDGNSRPDHVFRGQTIQPDSTLCKRLEINVRNDNQTFKIIVDGLRARMIYRHSKLCANSKDGAHNSPCEFDWNIDKNKSGSFSTNGLITNGNKTNLLIGTKCEGNRCALFTIK